MATKTDSLIEALAATGAKVSVDPDHIEFYSNDIACDGIECIAVVRPHDKFELAATVKCASEAGHAVIPRGGGMSYTGGYTPSRTDAVMFDLSLMNRVVEVDQDSMNVTVEAGCTWDTLYRDLSKLGLRTPMWGTLSGLKATVGGTMSQNGIFWGSTRHGTAAQSCRALEVVLADGTLFALGKKHLRPYGPDLLGLFLSDCGAMGIKATVTMRLVREAKAFASASFSFAGRDQWLQAAGAIERQGIATECFGFDPHLNAIRAQRESLASDAKQLLGVMKREKNPLKAIAQSAKIVRAGREFLKDAKYSLHVLAEGRIQAAADADVDMARQIVKEKGGKEIENSIPKVIRANPFGPLNAILGPKGERWAPIHGHLPHGSANECYEAIEALFAEHQAAMDELGVHYGTLITVIAGGNTVLEPCLYWPDARNSLIEATVEAEHLGRLPDLSPNPDARKLAEKLKQALVDLFYEFEAAHFQIGRTYRYQDGLNAEAIELLNSIKRQVDPKGLMNPGVLDLQ